MKKITFILSVFALSIAVYMTSCKKTETTPSTTTTTGTTGTTSTTSGSTTSGSTTSTTSGSTTSTTSGSTTSTTSGSTTSTTSGSTTSTTSGSTTSTTSGTTTSGGGAGTVSIDGSSFTATYQMWVNDAAVMSFGTGASLQVWFKAKPTSGGTYSVIDFMTALTKAGTATQVGLAYLPGGSASQYWSTSTSGGTVTVTVTGTIVDIVVGSSTLCVNGTTDCKSVTAHYSL